jgi:hypothetical protein
LQHPDVQHAPFPSLRHAGVPAVLVNVGCLSNREDERRVRSAEHGARLAEAIARALDRQPGLDRQPERGSPPGTAASGAMLATSQ